MCDSHSSVAIVVLPFIARARRSPRRLRIAFALALLLACRDSSTAPKPSGSGPSQPFTPTPTDVARVDCVVSLATMSVSCAGASPASASRASVASDASPLATIAASNVAYAGQVLSFDAALTNQIGQALGTTDGVTPDANGVRAFFSSGPTVTSGSGTVDFIDPAGGASLVDGVATITGPNQPFYRYAGILGASQTSSAKRWRIHVPSSVSGFTFSVGVNGALQHPGGWIDVTPSTLRLRAGQTGTLSAATHDFIGAPIPGAVVSWSSSATGVATVNSATGVVTGAGDGAATITATTTISSGTSTTSINGTASVAVNSPSPSATTVVADPTSLLPGAVSTITVRVKNAAGVNFTIGGDTITLSANAGTLSAVTDRGDGTYTATLTSTAPRTVQVTGTLNRAPLVQTATVVFTGTVAAMITKLAGDAQTATVATAVATAPSVRITDASGRPMGGTTVTFAVASGGGSVSGATQTTGADGVATVGGWTLGPAAGPNTLTASVTGTSLTTTFSATSTPPAAGSMQKAAGDRQAATVQTSVGIAPSVRILDAAGNPVSGAVVAFTPSSGSTVTGASQVTNASGVATVGGWTLGRIAGPYTLTVTSGSLATTFSATGTADAPATITKVGGDAQSATQGTAVAVAPSVKVTDAFGNAVVAATVTFAVASGGGSVVGSSQTTDAAGVATVGSWTLGTAAGANTLTATSGSLSATFTATANPASAGNMAKSAGDAQSAIAGSAVGTAPAVRITDNAGNPIAGASVTFSVASGGGSMTGATQTTNTNGVATVGGWTLGTRTGANSLTATSGVLTATFTATATPGAPTAIAKTAGDNQSAITSSAVAVAPTVLVTDLNGNPVPGTSVTFTVASGGGAVAGGAQTTDANGIAAVGSWTLGSAAGSNTLTAAAGTLSTTFTATATSAAAGTITKLAGDGQSASVGTALGVAPSVRVADAAGNPLANVSVTFAAGNGGSVTGGTQLTNSSGVATVGSWTLGPALGANTLTVTAGTLSATFSATGVTGGAASMVKVAGDNQTAATGTAVSVAPSVKVTDAGGNPKPGVSVTFAVATGGGSVTGATPTTDASGVATVGSWTLGPAVGSNNNTLTATAGTLGVTFTASGALGTVHHFLVESAAGGPIPAQAAGVPFAIRITAQDISNNTVTSFTGTVGVASNVAASAGTGTSAAFVAGVLASHSLTLTGVSGAATITVTRTGGTEAGASNAFVVDVGALHHFLVEAAGGGAIATQAAGAAFSVQITAQDVANNTVTSFTGTVDLTSNRAGVGLGTTIPFTNGVLASHSITLNQSGVASTITATRTGGTETGTSAPFAVSGGALHHFLVEAQGGGVVGAQNVSNAFALQFTAQDVNNNTVIGFNGTVNVTSNRSGSAGLGTSAAFVNGILTNHNVTLTQAGAGSTITVTNSAGSETGTSNAFTVNVGTVHHFLVEAVGGGAVGTQTAGAPFNIQITAKDATNNTVTGFTGTVNVSSTQAGSAGLTTTAAFTNGVLSTHAVTLTQAGGGATITATRTGGSEIGTSAAFAVIPAALNHFLVEAQGGGSLGTQTAGLPINIQVTAQDAFNNIVTSFSGAGNTVGITSNRTGAVGLTTTAAFTNGVLSSHTVTLTQSGTATLTATRTSGGAQSGTSTSFTVNPGAVHHFVVEAAGGGSIPGQAVNVPFNVRLTAQDQFNNTATGFSSTVVVTSNFTGSSGLGTSASFIAGVLATHSVTLSQVGVNATITATRTGGIETGTSNTFDVAAGAVHHFLVEASPSGAIGTQTAGNSFAIRVTAQDASNNTVTGFGGTVNVTSNVAGSAGLTTSAAFVNGVLATHNVTLTQATAAATASITVTRTGGTETGVSTLFAVNPGSVHHFVVTAPGSATAGAAFSIAITAQDANNNTATAFTGTVNVSSTGTLTSGSGATAAFVAGVLASHNVTIGNSGSFTISVDDGGGHTGTSASVLVSAGGVHHFAVTTPATVTAGSPFSISITAQDAGNNTVTGFSGTVNVTSNVAGSAGLTTTVAFTNGVLAAHSVTLTQASASATITATRTGGSETGTSAPFAVNAAALHHFAVTTPASATAGSSFSISVTAQDQFGNTDPTFTGTVNVTSNRTGSAGLTTTAGFVGGVLASHNVTLTQATTGATATITATRTGGTETGVSAAFTVNAAAVTHFQVELAGGGSIPTQNVNNTFNLRFTALDQFNNTATSFAGTVDVTSNFTASGGLTTSVAFTNGVLASHAVTLTQSGTAALITVTRTGGTETGQSNAFDVNAGTVHHFLVEAAGGGPIGPQVAGVPFSVQITAQDASNTTVPTFTGTVTVTSTQAGSSGLTTTAAFVNGVLVSHAITLTQSTSGATATITATRTAGSENGTSTAFAVASTGSVHHFVVTAPASVTAGSAFSISVTAQDQFNNTETSFSGAGNTVNVTSNRTGTSGLTTSAAFTNGVLASHSVTLTQAGSGATVTATRTSGGAQTGTSSAFVVNDAGVHHFVVTTPASVTSGAAFSISITAQDQFNNTAASFVGTAGITSNVTGSSGLTTTAAFTAGVLASHSVTLTQSSASATITATRTGGTETGTSAAFAVGAGGVDHFVVSTPGTQTAGVPFTISITAQDAGNNTVTSFNGTAVISSNVSGSSGLTTTASFTSGVLASHSVTLTQASTTAKITATRSGGAETGTSTQFTVNAAALHHFVVTTPASVTAGTAFSASITAQDQFNNTATSFNGTANVTSNVTGSSGLTTSAAFTNGVLVSHSVTLTQATSGATATLTATRTGGTETGTSSAFTVNAAAVSHFAVEAPGGGVIASQIVNAPFSIRITALDQFNNTVTGFSGAGSTVDLTSTGTLTAGGGTSAAFTNGVLSPSVTIGNVGSWTITATKTGSTEFGTSNSFSVGAGALDHFAVEKAGGGAIPQQTAGTSFQLRITAQDIANNTVTSFNGAGNTVNLTSNHGTGATGLTTTSAFTAGVLDNVPVTLLEATTGVTITATRTSGGAQTGTSAAFTVIPGAVSHFTVTNTSGGAAIGTQLQNNPFNIEITALDVGNNVATGFNGTATLTSTGTLSGAPVTSAAFSSGVLASQALTITNNSGVGTFTVTATQGTATGTSAAFTVLAPLSATVTPTTGATNQAPGTTNIVFSYNRIVNAALSDFTLTCASTSVGFALTGSGTTTITLTPTAPGLIAGASCTVTALTANIADANGFHAPANITSTFSTSFTAGADSYNTIGNVNINSTTAAVPFSVTANDNVGTNTTIVSYGSTTGSNNHLSGNGVVTMVTTAGTTLGQFTYTPNVGFSGTDTFSYRLSSNGSTADATVTITVSAPIWFVNNNAGACSSTCDGRLTNPFTSLENFRVAQVAGGTGKPAAGQSIFVYESATNYTLTTALSLLNNQKLIGQDASEDLYTITGSNNSNGTAALPTMNTGGNSVKIDGTSGGITMATGATVTIRGLTIQTTGGTGLASGASFTALNFASGTGPATPDVTINTTGGAAMSLTSGAVSGTLASVSGAGGTNALSLSTITGTLTINAGTLTGAAGGPAVNVSGGSVALTLKGTVNQTAANTVATVNSHATNTVDIQSTLSCTTSCTGIAVGSNTSGTVRFSAATKTVSAVSLTSNTGATIDFSNGGLAMSGGFTATGGGTVTVQTGTNNNTISSGATQAVNMNGVTVGSTGITFASVNSTGGTNNMSFTSVTNTSGSTISLGSGALSGATGSPGAFVVNGGSTPITYNGTIGQTSANKIVSITNSNSGSITLGGALTCGTSCTGIDVSSLSGSPTVTFSANGSSVSAGANTGINLSANGSGTVLFSGNSLAVTTSTGTSILAGTSGTLRITGTGNTLATTSTGTALNVQSVTIGTGGLNFQSIDTETGGGTTAANGIILVNTGTTAGLTVSSTGAGTCTNAVTTGCSGGHIRATSGTDGTTSGVGIYLSGTRAPSFTRMLIDGTHTNFGIFGTGITSGITLTNVIMNGATYGDNAANFEGTMTLTDLAGTGTVSNSHFAGGKYDNVRVVNTSSTTGNLTFSGTTFGTTQTNGNTSLGVEVTGGTSTVTANSSSSFTGGHASSIDYTVNGGTATFQVDHSTFTNTQVSGSNTFHNFILHAGNNNTDPTGTVNYTVDNNVISGAQGEAIYIVKDRGSQALVGAITNNTIGNSAVNSGSKVTAIQLLHAASGSNRTVIAGNNIQHYGASNGIKAQFAQPTGGALANNGAYHLTITNNTLTNPDLGANTAIDGVGLNPNTSTGNHTICVNFGHGVGKGNSLNGSYAGLGGPFAFGFSVAGGTGFFKMLGLSTLTNAGVKALGVADNSVNAAGTTAAAVSLTAPAATILSDTGVGGATCSLLPAP